MSFFLKSVDLLYSFMIRSHLFLYAADNFHKALEMMNRAVSNGQQPGARESVSYLTNVETNAPPPPPPPRVEVCLLL